MTFRVCTFNVRRFTSPTEKQNSTVGKIIEAFKTLKHVPEVVCLNEVDIKSQPEALDQFSDQLGKMAGLTGGFTVQFFGHVQGVYGNAILLNPSCVTVQQVLTHDLPGGSKIVINKGQKNISGETMDKKVVHIIKRGLIELELVISMDQSEKKLRVCSTHLDHISETEREIQLKYISENILGSDHGALLLGDFNAMKRSDFSEEEWKELVKIHENNGWEGPHHSALLVLENHENEWTDCFEQAFMEKEKIDSLASLRKSKKFSAHVVDPLRRIDHVFANGTFMKNFKIVDAFLFKECMHSDHFPVVVDFSLLSKI